ncbi:MAG: type I DNA topoisomerase [Clostridia bacterium]|nr:type I DNA topoisomerase [Clostridia bacterium]
MKKLVIVESPSKAKTIEKYLGRGYKVVASMGHVMDLPRSVLGVDIENDFTPKYLPMRDKKPLIKDLTALAKECDKVFLATDPDREGEAISWHLMTALKLNEEKTQRVTFNEITEKTVKSAIKAPRKIDADLVDAYQARRVLDRIVGYKLSPVLWKTVRKGLSAGRVQSVAVRIVVLREREIQNFVPKEYWNITVYLDKNTGECIKAKFLGRDPKGEKQEITSLEMAQAVERAAVNAAYQVVDVKRGRKHRRPAPPFITSSLQQEASRRYNFSSRKTMMLAQNLYEGVSLGERGMTGLITYMRTDSLRLSEESVAAARSYIGETFGPNFLPAAPRVFKTKGNAQDAHDAIRPANPAITPADTKPFLTPDQQKIYKLIWDRFTASQMADAVYDTVSVLIESQKAGEDTLYFRTGGSVKIFAGYTALYEDTKEGDKTEGSEDETGEIPNLNERENLLYNKIEKEQKFTQPPARYTEATLIRALEENGIGRPSTYAPTIGTILDREYIVKEGRSLKPTELGTIVTELMEKHFAAVVDTEFTANMETELDAVSEGKEAWKNVIRNFWGGFRATLEAAEKNLEGVKLGPQDEVTDIPCEKCGRMMVIKNGRFGKFLACPGYPECKNAKSIAVETEGRCPVCGGKMLVKKAKSGNKYFGCENYPNCNFMTWDLPIKDLCPKCGKTLFKKNSKAEKKTYCAAEGCGYEVITGGYLMKKGKKDEE